MSVATSSLRSKRIRHGARIAGLLLSAVVTMGSGTCIVVEEGPPGGYEEPGINDERMEEQELEVIDESDR